MTKKGHFYEAGMAPPIGGVESGGKRSDFSFADMAAISGSWVSYIFTNLANFKTPRREAETLLKNMIYTALKHKQMSFVSNMRACI